MLASVMHDEPLWQSSEADKHQRAINCVDMSPDGSFIVTGGEDAAIQLWETATSKLLYRFPAGHRGGVTSVQFLPGSQLVSAGRDLTIHLWTVGRESARMESTRIDRRSGHVPTLTASPDGKRVLFDQGKQIQVLSLLDGRPEGVLQNATGATNFTTMAEFSPDGKLILTAANSGGTVQL